MVVKPKGDYIGGKFVRQRVADSEIPSVDPGDSDVIIGDFPVYEESVEAALSAAHAALPPWSALPPAARVTKLQKLRAELRNRSDELVLLLSSETGRPLWETRDEVLTMHSELDAVLQHSLAELALAQPMPSGVRSAFEPLGVVAVLTPYTQPALLMHFDSISALVAGCTVICKPSEQTPAVAQLYAEIVHEADLPRGVFNMVQGGVAVGRALVESPRTNGVLFTGSAAHGQELVRSLAGHAGKMVRTLVSGHAAALVMDDAHLDEAAYQVVIGACTSTGQRCSNTHSVLVQRRIAEPLTQRMVSLLQQIKVGYATDPGTFMGPLISAQAVDRYLAELKRVGDFGAHELVHGAPLSSRRRGFYVTPALLQLAPDALAIAGSREVNGPALGLAVVDDIDEALDVLREGPFDLALSVFCRSERTFLRVQERQAAGLCLQNLPTTHIPVRLPLQQSGLGSTSTRAGTLTARSCARLVTSLRRVAAFDPTMLPPGLPRE